MNAFKKGIAGLGQLPTKLFRKKKEKLEVMEKDGLVYVEVQPKQLTRAGKIRFLCYVCIVVLLFVVLACTAFAADDPLTVINNLSNFIFSVIRAIGLILLGWGIVQVGLSLQSHDPSQRSNGFLTLAGGIIITFAKEILTLITGG
ncbi:MAG: glutamyl-tRNA amidotransferase [Clostridia bacterium]|nr:glutamyl-tRNA amidotransferase [Clostridia bacterium]